MRCIERFRDLRDDGFDVIMILIEEGGIKCGKYTKEVRVSPTSKPDKRKEFFNNESSTSKRK